MSKSQLKSITVCTRADKRSYLRYKQAAETAGLRLTDWIRARLQAAADKDLAKG